MVTRVGPTIEDLYSVPDGFKAEIVDGELVLMAASGYLPGYAAGEIFSSLREYARRMKTGHALGDNIGYTVKLTNRTVFSPDAAFYTGQPTGMRFLEGAPVFAVEVRSEGDYGRSAERKMAKKRADYFAAGTLVVWDVDLLSADVVRVYRSTEPAEPYIYRRGEVATAEPAVPGWQMPVDDLFPTK